MKRWFSLILITATLALAACGDKEPVVTIHTPYGDMKVVLYNQTPEHKESFLRMAEAGEYDSTIFHRVIDQFMIQGGDISRINPDAEDKTIPFEYEADLIHRKGALAGARIGERGNPTRASGTQWYIVQGDKFVDDQADLANSRMMDRSLQTLLGMLFSKPEYQALQRKVQDQQAGLSGTEFREWLYTDEEINAAIEKEYTHPVPMVKYTADQYSIYANEGGTPHLDGGYTVFGQVIQGIEVIDKIAAVETYTMGEAGRLPNITPDQPKEDIKMYMTIELLSPKDIEKEYGFVFPSMEEGDGTESI